MNEKEVVVALPPERVDKIRGMKMSEVVEQLCLQVAGRDTGHLVPVFRVSGSKIGYNYHGSFFDLRYASKLTMQAYLAWLEDNPEQFVGHGAVPSVYHVAILEIKPASYSASNNEQSRPSSVPSPSPDEADADFDSYPPLAARNSDDDLAHARYLNDEIDSLGNRL